MVKNNHIDSPIFRHEKGQTSRRGFSEWEGNRKIQLAPQLCQPSPLLYSFPPLLFYTCYKKHLKEKKNQNVGGRDLFLKRKKNHWVHLPIRRNWQLRKTFDLFLMPSTTTWNKTKTKSSVPTSITRISFFFLKLENDSTWKHRHMASIKHSKSNQNNRNFVSFKNETANR